MARADDSIERRILLAILREATSPALSAELARTWTGETSTERALTTAQPPGNGLPRSVVPPRMAPVGTLESTLPHLLETLSDTGQAVLADNMGFACDGRLPGETGEALAAVGADILSVAERQSAAPRSSATICSMAGATSTPPASAA